MRLGHQLLERSPAYLNRITSVVQGFKNNQLLSEKALGAMRSDVLQVLDNWHSAAQVLQKSPQYQQRIKELKAEFQTGKPLSTKPLDFLKDDILQQQQHQGRQR